VELNEESPVHARNGDTVPLKEFIEALIAERDKAVKEAIRQMEMRLDELNKLRAEVSEDRGLYLTREKYDTEHKALQNSLTEQLDSVRSEVRGLDRRAASQEAVSSYKRLMYAAIGTGLLAFAVAMFNLVTKAGT
jgi:exonuclease VII large subunit